MLTPVQKQLIETSYRVISLQLDEVGAKFYDHLFTLDPSLRALFRTDIHQQGMKLMQTIGFAVSNLHMPEVLTPVLKALGQRHTTYGVKPEYYPIVGQALLATLAQVMGEDFTPELREAWAQLYQDLVVVTS
ncbi:MAG: globin domain-containing protein [Anaerolineae bacterium]|jgi:hemoglobin-like flavoprotein|nr:globin domain-containing protein [Anaerolineae bacterium]